jgi:septum formation protein
MSDIPVQLILGSSSPYRRELLLRICPEFETASPDVDEIAVAGEEPATLAMRLAKAKASSVGAQYPESLVIGSDQVATVDGNILGKPGNHDKAYAQLSACSGKQVSFYTAVSLQKDALELDKHLDQTVVTFRELTGNEIDAYLAKEQPWDCAGSFKSEGLGVALFESIETNDPNALIGLPLIWLCGALKRAGIDPLTD